MNFDTSMIPFVLFTFFSNVIIFMVLRAAFYYIGYFDLGWKAAKNYFQFLKPSLLFFVNFNGCFVDISWISFEMCVVKEISTKMGWKFRQFLYNILKNKYLMKFLFAAWITGCLIANKQHFIFLHESFDHRMNCYHIIIEKYSKV
jgi:hypothetical protein